MRRVTIFFFLIPLSYNKNYGDVAREKLAYIYFYFAKEIFHWQDERNIVIAQLTLVRMKKKHFFFFVCFWGQLTYCRRRRRRGETFQ